MAESGPWEDFAPAAPEAGPWVDYRKPKRAQEAAPSTFQKKAVEETAPPVAERFKEAGRFFGGAASRLVPFPGVVAATTGLQMSGGPTQEEARNDPGALLNPMPTGLTGLFGSAQTAAEKLGLGKEFEAGMAMAPFMTHGAPIRPGLIPEMLRRPTTEATMAPEAEIMGPPKPPIVPQQPQVSSPASAPAAAVSPPPAPAAAPPISRAARMAQLEAENAKIRAELQRTPIEPTQTAEAVPAEKPPVSKLDTPESRAAHAKVKEFAAQTVARMPEETKGMTAEQKTAWLDDQLIKAASERVDAERAAAGEAQRTELQRGSITVPRAQNIGSWLDRTLNAKELTKDIIREKTGEKTAVMAQAEEALRTERKRWANAPTQDSLTFFDKIESGDITGLPARDQPLANTLRTLLDKTREDVRALGTGKLENWIENYFPHIWEKAGPLEKFRARIMGKRPLEGPATGLKERSIPTMKEGMSWRVYSQQGDYLAAFPDEITANARASMIPGGTVRPPLKPVTFNPIDNALLRIGEMQKYIAAHKIKDNMVDRGTAKFVRFGKKPPEGWQQLDDKMFRVLQYSPEEKGFVIRGQYYAPEGAAKVFNNYLSPGLKGNWAFDAARAVGNVMNQAQLGLSFFHAGFTTLETGVSDLALAVQKFSRGDISGGARAATYSLSGHTWLNNPLIGHKVLRNYLEPGSYPQYDRAVGLLKSAGGRPFQSEHFTNQAIRALEKGWQDKDALLMARKLFPAALEFAAKPTMEWLVPRQKMGAFAKLAQDIIERGDREGWSQDKIRHEGSKAWDTIDNRLGQMTYDNMMVNKVVKDLAFVGVRSVGWNFGSVREFGGGLAVDLPRELLRAATGRGFEVTPRMAYSLALPIYAGWAGFVTTVALTGKLPQTVTDLFYPPTGTIDESGKPERLNMPTYMKDIIGVRTHPVRMAVNKLHPLLASTAQMLENKDFYGTQIRDPQAPGHQQIIQSAEFIAKQFLPFSIRAAMQRAATSGQATGADIGSQFLGAFTPASLPATGLSMIGIQPAPRSATGSSAERLVSEYSQMRLPQEVSQAQRQRSLEARQLMQRVKTGKAPPSEVQQAIRAGKLTQEHFDRMRANEQLPYLVRGIKGFQLHEALNVWQVADDKEKMQIKNTILNKEHLLQNYPVENRTQMQRQLQAIKTWYPGKRAVNQ